MPSHATRTSFQPGWKGGPGRPRKDIAVPTANAVAKLARSFSEEGLRRHLKHSSSEIKNPPLVLIRLSHAVLQPRGSQLRPQSVKWVNSRQHRVLRGARLARSSCQQQEGAETRYECRGTFVRYTLPARCVASFALLTVQAERCGLPAGSLTNALETARKQPRPARRKYGTQACSAFKVPIVLTRNISIMSL
jgi:hypothetical protein